MPASLDILYAEDGAPDVELMREAMRELGFDHRLHIAHDGEEALSFLRRQGAYARAPRPDLLILDLNLPFKSGFEVLRELAVDEVSAGLRIAVLTTAPRREDVRDAAGGMTVGFFLKPLEFEAFLATVEALEALARTGPLARAD